MFKELKNYIFQKPIYRIPLSLIVDLGLVNFSFKTDLRIIITLERSLNKLFESNKKESTIPENQDAFINIYDRLFISHQEINLTRCFTYSIPTTVQNCYRHIVLLIHSRAHKDNSIGLTFRLFMINHISTQLFVIVTI